MESFFFLQVILTVYRKISSRVTVQAYNNPSEIEVIIANRRNFESLETGNCLKMCNFLKLCTLLKGEVRQFFFIGSKFL